MLIRIVRMYFKEDSVNDYLKIFEESKEQIRNFEGCLKLELLQDYSQEYIITTYSYWKDKKCLDNYRNSGLFMDTWGKTKKLFSQNPMAFSCIRLMEVPGMEMEKITSQE